MVVFKKKTYMHFVISYNYNKVSFRYQLVPPNASHHEHILPMYPWASQCTFPHLFINYLSSQKTRFGSFDFKFPKPNQLRNKYAKYTEYCLFNNGNTMVGTINNCQQVGCLVFNKFDKYQYNKFFFLARPFANCFVLNMSQRYGIHSK